MAWLKQWSYKDLDIEHHLGEIVKEVKGSLFAELPVGQGEEAGLLLDDVTAYFTWTEVFQSQSRSIPP